MRSATTIRPLSAVIPEILTPLDATREGHGDARQERPISPYAERYRWRFEVYHAALAPLLPAAKRFVSDVLSGDVAPYWLTILGPSGVGKTHLLRQVFRCLSRNEHLWQIRTGSGTYTTYKGEIIYPTRLPQCAHVIPGEDLDDYKAPRDYGRYDLCYVEDIGAGATLNKGSGAVVTSRVTELLQYRTGKWTLLCANLSRRNIAEKLDPRIASRLKRDGSVLIEVGMEVGDYWDVKRSE